ncbi:hypothetical protein [Parasediminibacterium sp. JCM 36343]|uniref:hypothetical protein n=1 Tax=Parasediminibacterium sp. JCM 36343 TaxID=3374279 RepID=UPI00397B2E6D
MSLQVVLCMANNTSQHILGTATNLLGFCLFVITSFHVSNTADSSIIDEFTSVITLLLTFSCIFSFISIRTSNETKERRFEAIADYLFIVSLIGVLVIIMLLVFKFIK